MHIRSLLLVLIFSFQSLSSQELYKVPFGRKDGLPSLTIYNSLKDKEGFQWFVSDLGILKYDGYNFNIYNSEDGIADVENFSLFEDSQGRIWFGSYNGKISFYKNGKFYNEKSIKILKKSNAKGYILRISENRKGEIFIIYSNGNVDIITGNLDKLTSIKNKNIIAHYVQNKNDFFLTTYGVLNSKFNVIRKLSFENLNKFAVVRMCKKNDAIYFSHLNAIYTIQNNNIQKLYDIPVLESDIISVYVDSNNKIWIGTRNGVYVKEINNIKSSFEVYYNEDAISSVNEDFENKIWVTTLDNGVYYIPNPTAKLFRIMNGENLITTCLTKDSLNNLWCGTSNDIYYKIESSNTPKILSAKSKIQSKNYIFQIYFSKDKQYIVGKQAIKSIGKDSKNISFIGSKAILDDQKGNLWIGANYLLKIPVDNAENLSNIGLLSSDKKVFLKERTNTLIQNNNTIWAGTNRGVYKIENDRIIYLSKKYAKTQTIVSKLYYDDETNLLYVATNSNGLFVFKNDKLIQQFNNKNGLNSNTLYSIKKSFYPNSLLVSSNLGVNQIKYSEGKFVVENLNKEIGIENLKVNDTEIIDSTLYLATDEGLISLNTKSLKSISKAPKLSIVNIMANGIDQNLNKLISLKHYENDITINFTGLSYISQKNISYFFKLSNKSTKWTSTKSRQINYQGLEPDKYDFFIYTTNAYGIKSKIEKVSFSIQKPFWKTYLFYFLILVVFGILLGIIWKKRLKSLHLKFERERTQIQIERDKANLEKQLIELEQKSLRMQMNPHFIFNALNTIKGYYSEDNDEKAGDYISKFSMLLRMLLENTNQNIPLSTEIKMLKLYIELTQIRYKNTFEYEIHVDAAFNIEDVAIPTFLLQPIVENAIIHGLAPKKGKGLLHISFEKSNDSLLCKVKDNGIGIKASNLKQRQHESKAISITKERLALLENENNSVVQFTINELEDASGNALGTEVILQIPFKSFW